MVSGGCISGARLSAQGTPIHQYRDPGGGMRRTLLPDGGHLGRCGLQCGFRSIHDGQYPLRDRRGRAYRACHLSPEGSLWSRLLRLRGHAGQSCRAGSVLVTHTGHLAGSHSGADDIGQSEFLHHGTLSAQLHPERFLIGADRRVCLYHSSSGTDTPGHQFLPVSCGGGSKHPHHLSYSI